VARRRCPNRRRTFAVLQWQLVRAYPGGLMGAAIVVVACGRHPAEHHSIDGAGGSTITPAVPSAFASSEAAGARMDTCPPYTVRVHDTRKGRPITVCARSVTVEAIGAEQAELIGAPIVLKGTRWTRGETYSTMTACMFKPCVTPNNCCNSCRATIELDGLPRIPVLSPSDGIAACGWRCCDPMACPSWIPNDSVMMDVPGRLERMKPDSEALQFRLAESEEDERIRAPASLAKFEKESLRFERAVKHVVRYLPPAFGHFSESGCAEAQLPEEAEYDPVVSRSTSPCAVRSVDGQTAVSMTVSNPPATRYAYVFAPKLDEHQIEALVERCGCPKWDRYVPLKPNWWIGAKYPD